MKDTYHSTKVVQAHAPANYTTTQTSAAIDTLGFESILIVVNIGAVNAADADNYVTFSLTECDALGGAYTAVDSGDYIVESTTWDRKVNAVGEANAAKSFGFKRSKANQRYIKVVVTETGTTDLNYGVTVLLAHGVLEPIY